MPIEECYAADVQAILAHRYDGGADFWTTPDNRLLKGTPFSAYTSAQMLLELGMAPGEEVLQGVAALFLPPGARTGASNYTKAGAFTPATPPRPPSCCAAWAMRKMHALR